MSTPIIIIIAILALLTIALLYLVFQSKKNTTGSSESEALKLMMEWLKDIKSDIAQDRELTQKNIHETNKQINDRLTEAARVIGGLQGKLGEWSQIGPDIRRLSEVLASPKARGNFGEEMLETLLAQVLPKSSYKTQYKFKNGEIVDMAVFISDKILSIDSKFSMENFRLYREAKEEDAAENLRKAFLRDVKKRIDEIHKKYILPQEDTYDFALMYIPSEGVLFEAMEDQNLVEHARNQKILMVGPNTLYYQLQIILHALRGQQVNEAAAKLMQMISGIRQESDKFGRNLGVLSNHIKNAGNAMGTVSSDYNRLHSSIHNAASLELDDDEPSQLPAINETTNN